MGNSSKVPYSVTVVMDCLIERFRVIVANIHIECDLFLESCCNRAPVGVGGRGHPGIIDLADA